MSRTLILLTFLAAALLLGSKTMAQTGKVTVAWNPSPSAGVTGYYVFYGPTYTTNLNGFTSYVPVGATATNLSITPGYANGQTVYLAAVAHDNAGNMSPLSTEISATVGSVASAAGVLTALVGLPAGQFGFSLTGASGSSYIVQASTDLVHWIALQTNTAPFQFVDSNKSQFARRFYRSVYISN